MLPPGVVRRRVQLAICWDIRVSHATSSVPSGRYRDNAMGADNQQERPPLSGGILRDCTPAASSLRGEDTVRAPRRRGEVDRDDRPAGAVLCQSKPCVVCVASNRPERNSLSGKYDHLPRRLARGDREPAHIGETLLPSAVGNPEGSPSDPLTTDPKGEARRASDCDPKIHVSRNTPALIEVEASTARRVAEQRDP
jgi:hypothetical protein